MPPSPPISGPGIIYFGDSLSDDGNLFAVSEGLIDESLRNSIDSPNGEISNGIVHSEYTPALLGEDGNSFNYAVAGAMAIGSYTLGQFVEDEGYSDLLLVPEDDPALDFDINLGAQVDRFSSDFANADLSDMTGFILIGANDYSGFKSGEPAEVITEALQTMFQVLGATLGAALDLSNQGMGTVVIATLPTSDFFPVNADLDPTIQALADLLFKANNWLLGAGADALSAHGHNVEIIDTAAFADALQDDPSAFGLIAPLTGTLSDGDPALLDQYDPDQIAFYDSVHPTTATHGMLGSYYAYCLENDPTLLDDGANRLAVGGGDNLVFAYAGNDVVAAAAGADQVFGGTGRDILLGGAQDDLLSGGSDHDRLFGGTGQDVLDGDEGNDTLRGGFGGDVLIDGLGDDRLLGGFGDDVFIFTETSLIGGDGPDQDVMQGGAGHDTLYLALSQDTLAAIGDDLIGPNPEAALLSLGITIDGIEDIVVLDGRAGISALSGNDWYQAADLWGLV